MLNNTPANYNPLSDIPYETLSDDTTYGHESNDTTLELRVPGIEKTTCYADTDYNSMLNLSKISLAGVYGPSGDKAHSHDDWVATGNITNPSAAGDFTVTGDGEIYLDLASNYESRLAAIPDQDFPSGMPGCPDMTFYHRAGLWRSYDGATTPSLKVWSEPAEATYCARGFPCLRLKLSGGAACTLTVTITAKTFSHNDNHYTDSTRQEDYTYSSSVASHVYTVSYDPSDTYTYVYLSAPSDGFDPDLEVVTRIAISGFANGDWTIDEPYWADDPNSSVSPKLKAFEGAVDDYSDGGLSAVIGSVFRAAMCDTGEDNNGHDNTIEKLTVRNFDYRVGRVSGIDVSAAYTLSQAATRITNICDAYSASVNNTVFDTATLDEDDSRLSNLWCFNICYELDASLPLVQDIDGSANVSIRCGAWEIASGIKYAIRPDKVIDGKIHGVLKDTPLGRNTANGDISKHDGSWQFIETPTTNDAGYWQSSSLDVVLSYDPKAYLEYKVDNTSGINVKQREYSIAISEAIMFASIAPMFPDVLLVASSANDIYLYFSKRLKDFWVNGAPSGAPGDNPIKLPISGNSCDIDVDKSNNRIYYVYERDGSIYGARSPGYGSAIEMANLIASGEMPSITCGPVGDVLHLVYYDGTGISYARSVDGLQSIDKTDQIVAVADRQKPDITLSVATKTICVVYYDGSGISVKTSKDNGDTWE